MYSYVHLEGVGSDGVDGPPQALDGSDVAGGVGAMDTLAVGAQGAAPVAEGAGDTEQRIRLTVPGLPRGNLTVAVLKSRLQMYGGAMFVLDIKTRYKAPNEHIFNKGAIKRAELLDAWHRFMDTPGDQGGFDPARMLSDEDLVVRKAAPGSSAGTRRGARRGAAATVPTAHPPDLALLRMITKRLQFQVDYCQVYYWPMSPVFAQPGASHGCAQCPLSLSLSPSLLIKSCSSSSFPCSS